MVIDLSNYRSIWRNRIHSLLLLSGGAVLAGSAGFFAFGKLGLLLSVISAVVPVFFAPQVPHTFIVERMKARPVTRGEAPGLYRVVEFLSRRAGTATPEIYVAGTAGLNAFSIGSDKKSVVVLSASLVGALPVRELTGVLAHEVAHIALGDLKVMAMADALTRVTSFMAFAGQIMILVLVPVHILASIPVPFIPLLILFIAPMASSLMQKALSRQREYAADQMAAELTGDPEGLARALSIVEEMPLGYSFSGIRRMKPAVPSIFRSHPDTERRVARLVAMDSIVDTAIQRKMRLLW